MGYEKVVQVLLGKTGIEINKATSKGNTPLIMAALQGHDKVVELLVEKNGIQINKANNYGATPLYLAAKCGHKKVVNLLLTQNGIQVNNTTNDGFTPLHIAALKGHENVVALLKKRIIRVPNDNDTCIVCMDRRPEVALVPCGHQFRTCVESALTNAKNKMTNAQQTGSG